MPVLLNILPNVYWMYNNPSASIPEGQYMIELHKVQELYGIKTVVELDATLAFWNKSNSYINEIKSLIFRDVLLNKFPFVIVFEIDKEDVIVYAVHNVYKNSNKKLRIK